MWSNITKSFQRFLVFNPRQYSGENIFASILFQNVRPRFLACSALHRNVERVPAIEDGVCEGDAEYIIPYKPELEKFNKAKKLMEALRHKFRLNKQEAERIMNDEIITKSFRQNSFMGTIDILSSEGISKEHIVEYTWLITLERKKLIEKINILKSLQGFRNINDFVPFLRLQLPRLRKLVSALNRETKSFDHGNRVYFIAEKLGVLPSIVTKYLAKRLFILEMPLDMFKANLEHMINYNVGSMNILKDLWGFRYDPKSVEQRLKRALQAKKDRIMPWMVRCPETILQKSLQLSLDELQVLGDKNSVAEYIGERLGFSAEEAQAIMDIHPQVNTVRVTKIKEVLDYLLDEAKFSRHEIAQVPRILCHSLDTTKQRIKELEKYGCRPSSLIIVCRSKREYDKFVKQWQQNFKAKGSLRDRAE